MSEKKPDISENRISEVKRERYRKLDFGMGYDLRYQGGANQLNTLVERAWIEKRLAPGEVLDAGAGTGRFSAYFAEHGRLVTALDSSPGMLDELRAKSPAVETVLGDLYQMPFESGRFANVVCMHVLFHLPDWQRVASELIRVLSPGGCLFFEMRSGEHVRAFSRAARGLGLLDDDGGKDQSSATIHVDNLTVRQTLDTLGVETTAALCYDLPHSYWFRPLLRPAENLLAKFLGLRSLWAQVELALGTVLPAALAYRTLYQGRKR